MVGLERVTRERGQEKNVEGFWFSGLIYPVTPFHKFLNYVTEYSPNAP